MDGGAGYDDDKEFKALMEEEQVPTPPIPTLLNPP